LRSSRSAKWIALTLIVPLALVAWLFAYNIQNNSSLEREAQSIASVLDSSLGRDRVQYAARLAILPLLNDSGRSDLEYLAAGLSADIRSRLREIESLLLIADESAMIASSQPLAIGTKAQVLGAYHLLSGTLTAANAGEIELVFEFNALESTGLHQAGVVWRQTWQGTQDDVAEASQSIANRVMAALLPQDQALPLNDAVTTPSATALDAWFKGRHLVDRHNREDILRGIEWLEQAISEAPTFDLAYQTKISAHSRMTWVDAVTADQHQLRMEDTIQQWLSLGLEHPLSYRVRAMRAAADYRMPEALAAFQLAVGLAPAEYRYDIGYMTSMCSLGYLDRCLDQALGLAREDPLSANIQAWLANAYVQRNEPDQAIVHAQLSTRFGGDVGRFYEAVAYFKKGDFDRAQGLFEETADSLGISASWLEDFLQAIKEPSAENKAIAVAAMQAADETTRWWKDDFYVEKALLGEIDLAYAAAGQLIDNRNQTWAMFIWDDQMRAFRDDPRFLDTMEAMQATDIWRIFGPPDVCTRVQPESFCQQWEM